MKLLVNKFFCNPTVAEIDPSVYPKTSWDPPENFIGIFANQKFDMNLCRLIFKITKSKILILSTSNLYPIWGIISQTGYYIPLGNWSQPIHKTWHSFSFILLLWTTKNNENYKLVNAYCRHVSICLKIKT